MSYYSWCSTAVAHVITIFQSLKLPSIFCLEISFLIVFSKAIFIGFLSKTMQKSFSLKTVKNIFLIFFFLFYFTKIASCFSPVLWIKGLGVRRITFDRILLYWKVSVSDQGRSVETELICQTLKFVPCVEEGIVLHLCWERADCHTFHLHGKWLCLPRTTLRASGKPPQQSVCWWCSYAGCWVLLWSTDHWLMWKTSEESHLFVTSWRTRLWLSCSNTLLFSRHL